ncbi:hypothetical protein CZ794_08975 [Psychrobacter sp. JB385]|nr:hypothetical protein CZ794_08975 [Psychrobacter sp. JB385]
MPINYWYLKGTMDKKFLLNIDFKGVDTLYYHCSLHSSL